MGKTCSRCDGEMVLTLRNVIYRRRARIHNVPVYTCVDETCAHSQVLDIVKEDLRQLMAELGDQPESHDVPFQQLSEFTRLLVNLTGDDDDTEIRRAVKERVDELLDLYLLAQSLGDTSWLEEIRRRLTQMQRGVPVIEHLHTVGSR